MSLSENFIKNEHYLDKWCERSLSVQLFKNELEVIYGTKNPSGRITPEKQQQVLDLVVKENFFVAWCKDKTRPKPLWKKSHNTPKTTTEEFEIPLEEIKTKLLAKMVELGINTETNKVDVLIAFLINSKADDFWLDEYYGESVTLQYIYITNDELKKIAND